MTELTTPGEAETISIRTLRFLLAVVMLVMAAALLRFGIDWRAPFMADMRSQLLAGVVGVSLGLILAQLWFLRSTDPARRVLWWLSALGLVIAILALIVTLVLEARFHWVRGRVLHADASRLEKVGRHLIVGYRDLAEVRELVKLRGVAGVFVSGRNVEGKSVSQVRQEIDSLQSIRRSQGLPRLWIATDQEGGIVCRLSPPLSRAPALSEIVERHADAHQRQQAVRELALAQGRELARIGVNLNFAPVVDLNYQVINPNDRYTRIFQRAIAQDPTVVAQVASWYCAALEQAGVTCTLKHFPGLGRVFEDTHLDPANLDTSVAELEKTDWVPFHALMRQSRAFIMLGHVRLTAIDPDQPVSLSSLVIAGMLRGAWKYDGVLITDNFSMMAVYRSSAGIDQGSIDALNAGVDLILVSYDPDQYYRVMYALLKAEEQGKLNQETLKRSDQRLTRAAK